MRKEGKMKDDSSSHQVQEEGCKSKAPLPEDVVANSSVTKVKQVKNLKTMNKELSMENTKLQGQQEKKEDASEKKDEATPSPPGSSRHHDEELGLPEGPVPKESAQEDNQDIEKPLIAGKGGVSNESAPQKINDDNNQRNNNITTSEIVPLTSTTTSSCSPSHTKGPPINMSTVEPEFNMLDTLEREKEERVQALSEDIYSLIYTADAKSQAFWFAIFVTFIQQMILWLILADLVDKDASSNQIQLPPGVPIMVNMAQGIGVLLIVFTIAVFGDLTTGLSRLTEGYNQDVLDTHPDAYRIKWFLSGAFQALAGLAMLMDLFILMMQSTTVVGMCLNFAALHFVQEIDDMSFLLGQKGFLTRAIQKECNHVSDLTVPKGKTTVRRRLRQFLMVSLTIGLYIPYAILVKRQLSGMYLCNTLYVQFGDAYLPELPYFSGPFRLVTGGDGDFHKIELRPIYVERSKNIKLAYCSKEHAWVFSLYHEKYDCSKYIIKSSPTNTFDVATVKDQTWYTWNIETNNTVPTDWFLLLCNDCESTPTGNCPAEAGRCIDNQCVCKPGRMGVNCQFPAPDCDDLAIDERTEPLPLEEGVQFPEQYNLHLNERGEPIQVHYHPVYVSVLPQLGVQHNTTDYMFFTGRRWVIFSDRSSSTVDFDGTNSFAKVLLSGADLSDLEVNSLAELEEALGEVSIQKYRPYFFSEPVDYGTPNDRLEPTGLDWYRAERHYAFGWDGFSADESQPLDVNFLCSHCNTKTNTCYNGGKCDPFTRTCQCPQYYEGSLCEHPVRCDEEPCLNRGTCSSWHGYCDCPPPYYGNLCQFDPVPENTLP